MDCPALICTADLDTEVIEDFITESSRSKISGSNGFVLAISPKEPIQETELTKAKEWWPKEEQGLDDCPPIKPFKTGFLNASVEDMGKFILSQFGSASTNCFVVLDERSPRDRTALIYMYHTRVPPELLEENCEASIPMEERIQEWVEFRLKWVMTSVWASSYEVDNHFLDFRVSHRQYFDENGVFQQPYLERQEHEFGKLPEEELAPWGPEVDESEWRYPESHFVDEVTKGNIKTYPATE